MGLLSPWLLLWDHLIPGLRRGLASFLFFSSLVASVFCAFGGSTSIIVTSMSALLEVSVLVLFLLLGEGDLVACSSARILFSKSRYNSVIVRTWLTRSWRLISYPNRYLTKNVLFHLFICSSLHGFVEFPLLISTWVTQKSDGFFLGSCLSVPPRLSRTEVDGSTISPLLLILPHLVWWSV